LSRFPRGARAAPEPGWPHLHDQVLLFTACMYRITSSSKCVPGTAESITIMKPPA
jgi:hypothetical protein